MCGRTPIRVKRRPVTYFTDNKIMNGKWCPFPRPDEEPPRWKLKNDERILWCPWCANWSIYKRDYSDRFKCMGICGWGNTDEFYVKTYNEIWWESVPIEELRKISIPAPSKRR
jgi:hypothetical protein